MVQKQQCVAVLGATIGKCFCNNNIIMYTHGYKWWNVEHCLQTSLWYHYTWAPESSRLSKVSVSPHALAEHHDW